MPISQIVCLTSEDHGRTVKHSWQTGTWCACRGWLFATLTTSDQDLLQSCGLDALMIVKMYTFGVQLFAPIAFLALVICK